MKTLILVVAPTILSPNFWRINIVHVNFISKEDE